MIEMICLPISELIALVFLMISFSCFVTWFITWFITYNRRKELDK